MHVPAISVIITIADVFDSLHECVTGERLDSTKLGRL